MSTSCRLARLLAGAVAAAVVAVGAGCGGAATGGSGPATEPAKGETAELWITRDRGAEVLFRGDVPAGLTVLQALARVADVETRYGGRYVQSIEGVGGSLAGGRDWFYFVNGVAADHGAAEYRLRHGEIAWWDYRRWRGEDEVKIVVGAFPEPFLHGFDGVRRPAVVTYERPRQRRAARALARLLRARVARRGAAGCCPNVFHLAAGRPCFQAETRSPRGPYRFTFAGDALALARDPGRVRFRYDGRPCG